MYIIHFKKTSVRFLICSYRIIYMLSNVPPFFAFEQLYFCSLFQYFEV